MIQETAERTPLDLSEVLFLIYRGKSSAVDGRCAPSVGGVKYCFLAFRHSTMLSPEGSNTIRPARTVMRAISLTFPSSRA